MGKYWWVLIPIALVVIYFVFQDQINNLLGIGGKDKLSCKQAFYIKSPDGKYYNVNCSDVAHIGQEPNIICSKLQVTFTPSGQEDIGERISITKQEFEDACKYIYHPPFDWYAEASKQVASSNSMAKTSAKKYCAGGVLPTGTILTYS